MAGIMEELKDFRAMNKKRGGTNNKNRLDSFAGSHGSGGADWGGCDPGKLQTVVVAINALGGAVTIGLSRDKGAHSLTLLLDGQRQTLWFNGDADLNEELDTVIGTLEAMD